MEDRKPENPCAYPIINEGTVYETGMTLRDYFAAKAMQSLLISSNYNLYTGNNGLPVPAFISKEAYDIADAMLNQREI